MRGRKPIPTKLKIANGNPGRRPLNESEPEPDPIITVPDPPDHLSDMAKNEWRLIAPNLVRTGVMTVVDVTAFEVYCESVSVFRKMSHIIKKNGSTEERIGRSGDVFTAQSAAFKNMLAASRTLKDFAVEFGLTPSSRCRLHVPRNTTQAKTGKAKYFNEAATL